MLSSDWSSDGFSSELAQRHWPANRPRSARSALARRRYRPATPAGRGAAPAKCPKSCGRPSDRSPHAQQFGEKGALEHAREIRHARRPAGAGLETDDPLYGLQMAKAPALEMIFEIDQLFRQLVKVRSEERRAGKECVRTCRSQ